MNFKNEGSEEEEDILLDESWIQNFEKIHFQILVEGSKMDFSKF